MRRVAIKTVGETNLKKGPTKEDTTHLKHIMEVRNNKQLLASYMIVLIWLGTVQRRKH